MEIRVLGDRPTVEAMRLAGLEGRAIDPSEDCGDVFEEMLAQEGLAVLLVTEQVAARIRPQVDKAKLARRMPLVLEIPARGAPSVPVDELITRVARMVGLRA